MVSAVMTMPAPLQSIMKGKKRLREEYESPAAVSSLELPISSRPISRNAKVSSPARAAQSESARSRGFFIAFIDRALQAMKQGDRKEYNELVALFQPAQQSTSAAAAEVPSLKAIRAWLEALTHIVHQFTAAHATLIEAVIALPWTLFQDDASVRSYIRFVGVLVSTRPEFVKTVVDRAVKGLRWNTGQTSGSEQQITLDINRKTIYDRVHTLIRHLLDVVPTIPTTLLPCIERNFPNKREKRDAQVVYFRNVLQIVEYCPSLAEEILDFVITRATKFDVEIQVDMEEWEDETGTLQADVFGFDTEDPFDRSLRDTEAEDQRLEALEDEEDDANLPMFDLEDISSDEEASDSDHTAGPDDEKKPEVIAKLKDMAAKLDALLEVIFRHLEAINACRFTSVATRPFSLVGVAPLPKTLVTAEESKARRDLQFLHLLSIFKRTILKTFKTRNVQFILFWYSSLSIEYADQFTGELVDIALYQSDQAPTVTRLAACGYLASYTARAKFMDASSVRQAMSLLCNYLEGELATLPAQPLFLAKESAATVKAQVQHYAIFYAVVQAAMYIFCYRWKDLLLEADEEEEELGRSSGQRRWLQDLETLKSAILSHLNPLKICAPAVVATFAKVAHRVGFAYCFNVINSNKRSSVFDSPLASEPSTPSGNRSSLSLSMPVLGEEPQAPSASSLVQELLQEAQVETHFPFDPYRLPHTKRYVESLFREFEAPPGMDEEESTDDELDEVEEGGLAIPGREQIIREGDELGRSLEAMSITPD